MVHPQEKQLIDAQRSVVEAALNAASSTGICFDNVDAIDEYLKNLLPEHVRRNAHRDILDWFLRQKARGRSLPTPPLGDGSQSNTFETNLDADGSEKSETIAIEFVSEEPSVPISFFRQYSNTLHPLNMRICKGSDSFISETVVRDNLLLRQRGQRTILEWFRLGQGTKSTKTRCKIVDPNQIPNCDIALGEDHGRDDTEEIEDEEDTGEPSTDPQPNTPVSSHVVQSLIRPSYSPEEATALKMASEMNYDTALYALKRKAPATAHQCSSTSFPVDPEVTQYKRSRIR